VNAEKSFCFTKDSVYVQESRLASVLCVIERTRDPVSRLSLVVVNEGKDYNLMVAAPYAIFDVRRDTLRVQQVDISGISVRDLQYFPWPTEFGDGPVWVLARAPRK